MHSELICILTVVVSSQPNDKQDARTLVDPDAVLVLPPLLTNATLMRKVSDKLITPFNQMTTFYVRRSVEKAFQMDEQPHNLSLNMNKPLLSNPPHISSAVDDVMYIVNQIIQRSLATSQRAVIASVIPTISRVLSSDFVAMIQRKMRDESYPKPSVQGGLPPEHVIVAFLVLLNNLDVATDYIKRIVRSKLDTLSASSGAGDETPLARGINDMYPFNHDATFVRTALSNLEGSFEAKTTELINDGIYLVFKNVMKPRLRPILADTFRDIDYGLSEEELEEINRLAEQDNDESTASDDVVLRRFQSGWEALTKPIARVLTEANFDRLLTYVLQHLGEVLEKRIWAHYGRINSIGAVRLERDIAAMVSLVVRGARYALRDSFTRCSQICLVMNMEEDEWEEVKVQREDEGVEWKIDAQDRERARGLVRG